MDIYELSVDSSDASELIFPIPKHKEKFLKIIEEKVSNGISAKDEWEEFLVLKIEPKSDVNFYDIDDKASVFLMNRFLKYKYEQISNNRRSFPLVAFI